MHCFKTGKGVHQGCILSLRLFNLYTEYIMQNDRLDESQAGIKIAGRNTNNLRYGDDTTLIAESEEELTSLFMKVKSESEVSQLCPTLRDPMDCSLPDSSVHGIFQERLQEWGAITPLKALSPNTVMLGAGLQHMNGGRMGEDGHQLALNRATES